MRPVAKRVRARAPMSSANLSAGFDVLGVALNAFYDEVEVELGRSGVYVEPAGLIPESNTATAAIEMYLERVGYSGPFAIRIKKGVPVGLGLGSSGATAAAALAAVNAAFGGPLDVQELIDIGAKAEGRFSGSPHADNVAPSLLGGFAFVYQKDPYRAFSVFRDWPFVLLVPEARGAEGKTERARGVLGAPVDFSMYVEEKYAFNGIIKGILFNDYQAFSNGIGAESYHQLVRLSSGLLGKYAEAKGVMLSYGIKGACVSGAGPSILVAAEALPEGLLKELSGLGYREVRARVSKGPEVSLA